MVFGLLWTAESLFLKGEGAIWNLSVIQSCFICVVDVFWMVIWKKLREREVLSMFRSVGVCIFFSQCIRLNLDVFLSFQPAFTWFKVFDVVFFVFCFCFCLLFLKLRLVRSRGCSDALLMQTLVDFPVRCLYLDRSTIRSNPWFVVCFYATFPLLRFAVRLKSRS